MSDKKQSSDDYMQSVAEELRLHGVEKVAVFEGQIYVTSLGVEMKFDCAHRPNLMADVYRCISNLGLKIHNVHLENKLQAIKTFERLDKGGNQ